MILPLLFAFIPTSYCLLPSFITVPSNLEPSLAFEIDLACPTQESRLKPLVKFEIRLNEDYLFLETFDCSEVSENIKALTVRPPDKFTYNYDLFNPKVSVSAVTVGKIFVAAGEGRPFTEAASVTLPTISPYQRPFKQPALCLTWRGLMDLEKSRREIPQCPADNDAVSFLTSHPVVFQSGAIGVVERIPYPVNERLSRVITEKEPDHISLSWFMYINEFPENRGSILHMLSVGGEVRARHPIILLEKNGDIFFEANSEEAFISHCQLKLNTWYRLQVRALRTLIEIQVCNSTECKKYHYNLKNSPSFEPYSSSLVLGGSVRMHSFAGYMADVTVQPGRAAPLPSEQYIIRSSFGKTRFMNVGIAKFDEMCGTLMQRVSDLWQYHQDVINQRKSLSTCSVFSQLSGLSTSTNSCPAKPETSTKHSLLSAIIRRRLSESLSPVSLDDSVLQSVGIELYSEARKTLGIGLHEVRYKLAPYILQSACLGYGTASYMAAVMYFTGFGIDADENLGSLYLIHGALLRNRLALMSLGFNYMYGLNGFQKDHAVSWRYYIDVAWLFHEDRERHNSDDLLTENVRLTDKKALDVYLGEKSDHFQFLKFQASQGIESARQELGALFYWGSRGVGRDMGTAVQYYRELVAQGNINAHFDLGLTMLRGLGTEQNVGEGLKYLKIAADHGHNGAYSALGWHYLTQRNYGLAAKYLQLASNLGHADSMHNLGHMHNSGLIPGSARNLTAAYELFIRAAQLGQPDSAISLSQGLIYGEAHVIQNPETASQWARIVGEQVPAVGKLLHEALQSYLHDRTSEALMLYMMAAETGLEVASYNMGYLCETDSSGLAESYVDSECVYKYYNQSLLSLSPSTYAMNKMGDYHFYGCLSSRIDPTKAAEYYVWAAQSGDAEAFYNLAFLLRSGYQIDWRQLERLGVPSTEDSLESHLFDKCQQIEMAQTDGESLISPCMIARYHWAAYDFLGNYSWHIQIFASALAACLLIIGSCFLRHRRGSHSNSIVDGV